MVCWTEPHVGGRQRYGSKVELGGTLNTSREGGRQRIESKAAAQSNFIEVWKLERKPGRLIIFKEGRQFGSKD